MVTEGTTGQRVNIQSLYIREKRGGVYAETITHLVPVDRATREMGFSSENIPIERVFSGGVGRATSGSDEPIGDRDAWCKANLALSSPALLVDFHVSASSVVQVLSFSLADIYGAGVWTGVRVTGVA